MATKEFEITVSARRLSNRDTFSNSDPFCILHKKPVGGKDKWEEVGRTEVIKDNANPDWVKKFVIALNLSDPLPLKFEVYDYDPISFNEFLGHVKVESSVLLGSAIEGYRGILTGSGFSGKNRTGGELLMKIEPYVARPGTNRMITMQFAADRLDKKDFMGKSDPYLIIFRCNPDGSKSVAHRTAVVRSNLSPTWEPFTVSVGDLCSGDSDRIIRMEVWDWDDSSTHDLIGVCKTTLRRISEGVSHGNNYELINDSKIGKSNYTNSGFLKMVSFYMPGGSGAPADSSPLPSTAVAPASQPAPPPVPQHTPLSQPMYPSVQPTAMPFQSPPGYPQQAPSYPPQQAPSYPPQQAPGYPPQQAQAYPPQQAPDYPPQQAQAYPPYSGGSAPPSQPAYGYPPQSGYPPMSGEPGYPPQVAGQPGFQPAPNPPYPH